MKLISVIKEMKIFGIAGAGSTIGFSLLPVMEGKGIHPLMLVWFFFCVFIVVAPYLFKESK